MKISLLPAASSSWKQEAISAFRILLKVYGSRPFTPLGISTLQFSGGSFLIAEDSYGVGLCYAPIPLFGIVDPTVPGNWIIHHYSKPEWGSYDDSAKFFVGIEGLADDRFIDEVVEKSPSAVAEFNKIARSNGWKGPLEQES